MAGRGRGWSHGRSPISGGSTEEVQSILQPPPLYPPIDKKPLEQKIDSKMEFVLLVQREFRDHFNEIAELIDVPDSTESMKDEMWSYMPKELKSKEKTRAVQIKSLVIPNLGDQLNKLEKLEKRVDKTGDDGVAEEEEEQEKEDFDEEMDDGTDYANDYFDNGEAYEEDNDGDIDPIY